MEYKNSNSTKYLATNILQVNDITILKRVEKKEFT